MAKTIHFTNKEEDHSTENGFQFEFFCDNCDRGFKTKFKAWGYGVASSVLDKIGDISGGVLDSVGDVSETIRDAKWEKAHDKAYQKAIKEAKSDFKQCPECRQWVCREVCWDTEQGLCVSCAGSVDEEDDTGEEEIEDEAVGGFPCPECGHDNDPGDKFCTNCGAKLPDTKFCTECGNELDPGDKFCPECGAKVG